MHAGNTVAGDDAVVVEADFQRLDDLAKTLGRGDIGSAGPRYA